MSGVISAIVDMRIDFRKWREPTEEQHEGLTLQMKQLKEVVDAQQLEVRSIRERIPPELDSVMEVKTALMNMENSLKMYAETTKNPAANTDTPVVEQVVTAMEAKLRSFAAVSHAAQLTLLQDQEKENMARVTLRCNMRIVGLEEAEGENVKERMITSFRDDLRVHGVSLERAVRLGNTVNGSLAIMPESDHTPLFCTLTGFSPNRKSQKKRQKMWLDVGRRTEYEQLIEKRIATVGSAEEATKVISEVATDIFSSRAGGSRPWFDDSCQQARECALHAQGDLRGQAHRTYMHFIQAKKRRWLAEQQRILQNELVKCPQALWKRFQNPKAAMELIGSALYDYVGRLYSFPNAVKMPSEEGDGQTFTEDEAERQLVVYVRERLQI
ncbi:hypothetical protein R1sor_018002 [Riccia sorocarpa]|uniref:Uncharacterized protein n=1 Tax=Riccia sorocarpa TaxID=122646 RepID=A0ABD3IC64_9MARC